MSAALVAAYRDGLGLASVAIIRSADGIGIAACGAGDDNTRVSAELVAPRWWCRRASDAERVAAAATVALRRRESRNEIASTGELVSPHRPGDSPALQFASEAVVAAAKRLNVVLQTDEDIRAEAMTIIARVDEELGRLQRAGELKSINASYRAYRLEASARGERIVRYVDWMRKYQEKLVRELGTAIRYI